MFGAWKRVRELEAELSTEKARSQQAAAQVHTISAHNDTLTTKLADLNAKYAELRGKDALDVEREIHQMRQTVADLQQDAQKLRDSQAQSQKDAEAKLAAVRWQSDEAATHLKSLRAQIVVDGGRAQPSRLR